MPKSPITKSHRSAFTLIELSIVLVIIGLIIGGVLVGQDLINAAEVRAQIGQIEKLNSAVNTFRDKYNCLPGDCSNAAQFGFLARTGQAFDGNGDGIIDGCISLMNASTQRFGCETALFWRDLSDAKLIENDFSSITDSYNVLTITSNPLLPAKIGNSNYVAVFSGDGATFFTNQINYFYIGGITSVDSYHDYVANKAISPTQAYNIDKKIDDGKPRSGQVMTAFASGGIHINTTYNTNNCATSATQYNTASTNRNSMLCEMAFQWK